MMPQLSNTQPPGFCLVLSAPSGTGKTTVSKSLLDSDTTIVRSVSMTTRPRRPNEEEGKDYAFTTTEHFNVLIEEGGFLEWAEVHGCLYGTPRLPIEQIIRKGDIALLVIDVHGGQRVKSIFPDAVLVFLVPPYMDSLSNRLRKRRTESEETIQTRLEDAKVEMKYLPHYTYRVVNEDGKSQKAIDTIRAIITTERCRISRWEA